MSGYFECSKCHGTFAPSYRYCPNCDSAMVEHTEELRKFNEHMARAAPASPAPAKESATQLSNVQRGELPFGPVIVTGGEWKGADPEQPSAALADDDALAERALAWARADLTCLDAGDAASLQNVLERAAASLRSVEPAPRGEQDVPCSVWCGDSRCNATTGCIGRIAREGKAT